MSVVIPHNQDDYSKVAKLGDNQYHPETPKKQLFCEISFALGRIVSLVNFQQEDLKEDEG